MSIVKLSEKSWVRELAPRLGASLRRAKTPETSIMVSDGTKLAYACVVHEYDQDNRNESLLSKYETDLLVCDLFPDGRWIPRVVIECKIGHVTTHDALTYSTKAATHKQVHPYLRYGFLAGDLKHHGIPTRLVKHGAFFDFMVTWSGAKPTRSEWRAFCKLVTEEIEASRSLQELLRNNRSAMRRKYHTLHRPLVLNDCIRF
jgi:hypothetical protein